MKARHVSSVMLYRFLLCLLIAQLNHRLRRQLLFDVGVWLFFNLTFRVYSFVVGAALKINVGIDH